MFTKAGTIGFVACLLFRVATAADPGAEFRFDHISLEHGLSQSSVLSLVEDQAGFPWIATEQEVDRFDGFEVDTLRYAPGESDSLTHSSVRSLLVDHTGALWVGTWDGLNRIDAGDLSIRRFMAPSPFDQAPFSVQADGLAQACEDRLLVHTRTGLWWLDLASQNQELTPLVSQTLDRSSLPQSWQAVGSRAAWLANARTLWRLDCQNMRLEKIEQLHPDSQPIRERSRNQLARLPDGRLLWASVPRRKSCKI